MQIAQSKLVRIINNDRIHIRYVHSAFNDIGTNEHIIFSIDKIKDLFFQQMTFHLAMGKTDTKVGTKPLDDRRHFRQTTDAVINKKHLPSSFRFKVNSITDK